LNDAAIAVAPVVLFPERVGPRVAEREGIALVVVVRLVERQRVVDFELEIRSRSFNLPGIADLARSTENSLRSCQPELKGLPNTASVWLTNRVRRSLRAVK
jgi:hypothetical protein